MFSLVLVLSCSLSTYVASNRPRWQDDAVELRGSISIDEMPRRALREFQLNCCTSL